MKSLFKDSFLKGVFAALVLFFTSLIFIKVSFADDAGAAAGIPSWVGAVLMYVQSLPKVGEYLKYALDAVAVVGAVMTALSTCLMALAQAFGGLAYVQLGWLSGAAAKLQDLTKKILPYVQYLSIYNVQKQQAPSNPPSA